MFHPNTSDLTKNYNLHYDYDAGGNRTVKIDSFNDRRIEYHYDVDAGASPEVYGSRNNRLMWYETIDTTMPSFWHTVSKTYYVYTYDSTYGALAGKSDGNVTRIITEVPGGGGSSESMSGGGGEEMMAESVASASAVAVEPEGGGSSAMMSPGGNGCPTGWSKYTGIRFGYAENGQAVTFVHDESWCAQAGQSCSPAPQNKYAVTWAREFAYDGARARYMDRLVNTTTLEKDLSLPTLWTDYDADEAYGDYTVSGSTATDKDAYQPGLWRRVAGIGRYLHNDHLGTLRNTSNGATFGDTPRVFTAFGEKLTASLDRYGYVGAYGYQSHAEVPFLHVGARYYDPASGRFLQRDPIGIRGGRNVYAYVGSRPTNRIDPSGLVDQNWEPPWGVPPKQPAPEPPPLSPQDELEQIRKKVFLLGGLCTLTGPMRLPFPWNLVAIPGVLSGIIDAVTHPGEPLNPVFGGSY